MFHDSNKSLISTSKVGHDAARRTSPWKPSAFRLRIHIISIFVCSILITSLQVLLTGSQRNAGIIFWPTGTEILFSQSFLFLHLPTIIALLFSIFWSWVDLQVKRLEPYYQLSKDGGSSAKDSLLLCYPFDFLPFVPINAARNRHWAVFWASTAIVAVTWGVVPLQAGIFATRMVVRTEQTSFVQSTNFLNASLQNSTLDLGYIHSAHGIIWLNETLPPYMTRSYALAPFKPLNNSTLATDTNWTAPTTLYGVDIFCEVPKLIRKPYTEPHTNASMFQEIYTSSNGCELYPTFTLGNDTIGTFKNTTTEIKNFSAAHIGFYSTGLADYYLENQCPPQANHTFVTAFSRNKQRTEDPPQNETRLVCEPSYYMQDVLATVDAHTRTPVNILPQGPKEVLPPEFWNYEFFERQMNWERPKEKRSGAFPKYNWPSQLEGLSTTQLTLAYNRLSPILGLAIGAYQHPLEELLDPEGLRKAYEAAYQTIFARSMIEVLDAKFSTTKNVTGLIAITVNAVTLIPAFTYVVQGLLGFICLCALALLYVSATRSWSLNTDPSTIASIMSLTADNRTLLQRFDRLHLASQVRFEDDLAERRFKLDCDENKNCIAEINGLQSTQSLPVTTPVASGISRSLTSGSIRPREFRSFMVIPFISLQVALAITLSVLLLKSMPYGLPQPTNKAIVNALITNYIPTAIATFIEPVWILVNRLLCMLQPLEELRSGRTQAFKSIDADYSSLPPQLVVFKAIKSAHFKLALVCLMALLANVLAVAFAGMFDDKLIPIPQKASFQYSLQGKFAAINGSIGPNVRTSMTPDESRNFPRVQGAPGSDNPSGAYTGGYGLDQFLVAESNYTAKTPLPPWTDNRFMYIPFFNNASGYRREDVQMRARTQLFGANLACTKIDAQDYTADVFIDRVNGNSTSRFIMTMRNDAGRRVTCEQQGFKVLNGPSADLEVVPGENCQSGQVAMELVLAMSATQNASKADHEFCDQTTILGWARNSGYSCKTNTTKTSFDNKNAVFVGCRPRFVVGIADVLVDSDERIRDVFTNTSSSELAQEDFQAHFSNDPSNMLSQSNRYLLPQSIVSWHNDSVASDFMNYFMAKQQDNNSIIDPKKPLPTIDEITGALYPVYQKLFAIWLGLNRNKLFLPSDPTTNPPVQGVVIAYESRIFISKPLFVVAEVILGTYAMVALIVYAWRPGRFLPRMPTSIAAVIALFAAGSAVEDMEGTSMFSRKERREHLKALGHRYGYGKFIGQDGLVHVGIEKEPFLKAYPEPGLVEKIQTGLSKRLKFKV
ncbi:hypothetical protein B0J11DRAFT_575858 [Dendryphion nanum]|uniref:Uncharacterized protein n=1 Tax=Dendryphion nanum TaxID=256645 RepID=A0A9P9IYM5_9PLEO|nr:hypothetical protein B0J11DRAFT_575858 [Dendryphion nanum]